jgi:hypothetical protein
MESKLVLFWMLGGALVLAAVWIVSNIELTVGVTQLSYVFAVLASYVLLLIGGLCWISVAVATRKR